MSKTTTLLVWPNPFHALDHEGRPTCVLPYEPEGDGISSFDSRRFVGAQVQSEILKKFPRGDARQTIQRTWFVYDDEPTKVPATAYYKQSVARGEIFAADVQSAAECGIVDSFKEPDALLLEAREGAIALWKIQAHEHHGDDVPEILTKFAFGPMKEAIQARKDAAAKAAEQAADEEKKLAVKRSADEAKKKAFEEAKKQSEDAKKKAADEAAKNDAKKTGGA